MKPIYWIIIVLFAGAIGAGAVYYSKLPAQDLGTIPVHHKKQAPALITSTNSDLSDFSSNTPASLGASLILSTVKGWNTYINKESGFQISYPGNLDVVSPDSSQIFKLQSTTTPIIFDKVLPDQYANKIRGVDYVTDGFAIEISEISADAKNAYVKNFYHLDLATPGFDSIYFSKDEGLPNDVVIIQEPDNPDKNIEYTYQVECGDPNVCNNQSEQVLISRILNTFKFTTDQRSINTSGWQTFTNSQYGFSFRYPQNWFIKFSSSTPTSPGNYITLHKGPELDSGMGEDPNLVLLIIFEKTNTKNILDYVEASPNDCTNSRIMSGGLLAQTEIGGVTAFMYPSCTGTMWPNVDWVGQGIHFSATYYVKDEVTETILSTFKFNTQTDVISLPKDQCPCWDGINHVCLPQTACE